MGQCHRGSEACRSELQLKSALWLFSAKSRVMETCSTRRHGMMLAVHHLMSLILGQTQIPMSSRTLKEDTGGWVTLNLKRCAGAASLSVQLLGLKEVQMIGSPITHSSLESQHCRGTCMTH